MGLLKLFRVTRHDHDDFSSSVTHIWFTWAFSKPEVSRALPKKWGVSYDVKTIKTLSTPELTRAVHNANRR